MRKRLFATTVIAAAVIYNTAAKADYINVIENLEQFDNEQVTVSGVISRAENSENFILSDETGNLEVNLIAPHPDIREGYYVTVQGIVDQSLGEELDDARVTVSSNNYNNWYETYYDTYRNDYDLGGLDANSRVDWDADIIDEPHYRVR